MEPQLTLMEQIIEAELTRAGDELAAAGKPNEVPAIQCQVFFEGGQTVPLSALKRGPLPRTYVMGMPAMTQDERGRPVPVAGKMMEVCFYGADVKRLLSTRDAPADLVIPTGGRIVSPHNH